MYFLTFPRNNPLFNCFCPPVCLVGSLLSSCGLSFTPLLQRYLFYYLIFYFCPYQINSAYKPGAVHVGHYNTQGALVMIIIVRYVQC